MSGRDKKVQLGARVPADVRTAAQADAKRLSMSLNGYMEHLIVQAHGDRPVEAPLAGQLTVDDMVQPELGDPPPDGIDSYPGEDTMVAHAQPKVPDLKAFARNCRNGTLHWKNGPGDPCKFCGGEA